MPSWLAYQGSLTAALNHTFGAIEVEKLQQEKVILPSVEAHKLGLGYRAASLFRKVILSHQDMSLVYAETYMPLCSLVGKSRHLRYWDTRPLGHYLFTQPYVERSAIHSNGLKQLLIKGQSVQAYQRESIFYLQGRPIIIYENFLPDFVAGIEK